MRPFRFALAAVAVLACAVGLSACAGLQLNPGASNSIQSAIAEAKALVPAAQLAVTIADRLVPASVAADLDKLSAELPGALQAVQDAAAAGDAKTVADKLALLESLAQDIASLIDTWHGGSTAALQTHVTGLDRYASAAWPPH